ncbi:MAG: sialidase, partial [Gammaproteobacteria bacterium]|nr:sialidase [Gammaproteobacteria bacterium]
LWISLDRGAHWAQFKGGHFPAVAVRDLAVQPRDNDLVLATHGRGIWIIDDITPLRHLTPEVLAQDATFIEARPVQQRIEANGGWANGAAAFVGQNPSDGAEITYYQRTRQLFGKQRIEVLDANGTVIDELPASTRRGLSRVLWTMHRRAPQVPPAVQLAQAGTQGPRVPPGNYTIRMEKNGKTYTLPLAVGLDRRVSWTVADRQAQYDAAMKVYTLFNDESALFARIAGVREQIAAAAKGRAPGDPLQQRLTELDGQLDALRKRIVATTEGGAITGEERLREHTDQLYGAITSWEGPPAQYQLDNIAALRGELSDVAASFEQVTTRQLPEINKALSGAGAHAIEVPPATAFDNEELPGSGAGGAPGARYDAESGTPLELLRDVRLWH